MASAKVDCSSAVESSANKTSTLQTEPDGQQLAMEIDAKVKESIEQAQMDEDHSSENDVGETNVPSKNKDEELDDQAYQDLLAQKAALEAELQEIINELQPLKVQLEALDKSIAADEAQLPILEAAMMEEVREFLAMSPTFMKTRPGA